MEDKIMKKILFLLLCVLCLTACGGENAKEKQKVVDDRVGYSLTIEDYKIMVGDDFSSIKGELGENYEFQEVPSCAFEGMDKIYTFSDYEIYNYIDGDVEKIYTITLLNDNISTAEGVKIGSTIDDVVSKYGVDYKDAIGAYTYAKGKTLLTFIFDNNSVISIEYKLDIE